MKHQWTIAVTAALVAPLLGPSPSAADPGDDNPWDVPPKRSVLVRDPDGDVDTDRGVGGWVRSIDVKWVRYTTFRANGRGILRIRTRVHNATAPPEPGQQVVHEMSTLDPNPQNVTLVVHADKTARPGMWLDHEGGYRPEYWRAWSNPKTNITGVDISTEQIRGDRIMAWLTVSTPSREGRIPRDETARSRPILK